MNITSRPIIPGTLKVIENLQGHGVRRYTIVGLIERHTDTDLLNYCGYTPEFGGYVRRGEGAAYVDVYTD
jgi:hypothetical protein